MSDLADLREAKRVLGVLQRMHPAVAAYVRAHLSPEGSPEMVAPGEFLAKLRAGEYDRV